MKKSDRAKHKTTRPRVSPLEDLVEEEFQFRTLQLSITTKKSLRMMAISEKTTKKTMTTKSQPKKTWTTTSTTIRLETKS